MTDRVESCKSDGGDTATATKLLSCAHNDSGTHPAGKTSGGSKTSDTHIAFPNPYSSSHSHPAEGQASATAKQQWTVAIDLTAGLGVTNKNGDFVAGASSQWKQLQKLAAETAGKPVTFVVSVDIPPPPFGFSQPSRTGSSFSEEKTSAPPETPEFEPPDTVKEYIVRDGQIKLIKSDQTQGLAADLTKLLSTATKVAPADHLALIIQSHGSGTAYGLTEGDGSNASIAEVKTSIQSVLKDSGHSSLDVLDFDSCLSGSASTLLDINGVADHIVASSEEESSSPDLKYDCQNLSKVMSDLLHTPLMTPSQLGDDFIRHADLGDNGSPEMMLEDFSHAHSGTDTLANFDMSKYPQFLAQLNNFGQVLDHALKSSPQNKAAIIATIDQTQSFPANQPSAKDNARDLMQFTERIQNAIKNGQISDPAGKLTAAAKQLLEAQETMTSSFHHSDTPTYSDVGGLSVDLPPVSNTDLQQKALSQTILGQVIFQSGNASFSLQRVQDTKLQETISALHDELKWNHVDLSAHALDVALAEAEKATNPQAYGKAIDMLHKAAEQLAQNPQIEAEVASNEQRIKKNFKAQPSGDGASWDSFIADLYSGQ